MNTAPGQPPPTKARRGGRVPGRFLLALLVALWTTAVNAAPPPAFPLTGTLLCDPARYAHNVTAFQVQSVTAGNVGPPRPIALTGDFTWSGLNFNPDGWGKGDGPSLAGRISPDGTHVLLPNMDSVADYVNAMVVNLSTGAVVKAVGGWFPEYGWSADSRRFFWIHTADGPSTSSFMHMVNAATGEQQRVSGDIDTAAWARDGETLVYSQFPVGRWMGKSDPLHHVLNTLGWRRFFAVRPGGTTPVAVTPAEVDALMGKAYRQALRVYAVDGEEPDFGRGGGCQPYRILPAPDGKTVFVWSEGTPNTVRTRWLLVNGAGRTRYGAIPDAVLPYAWSRDSRYVYFIGNDRLVAYDTQAGRRQTVFRLFLRSDWGSVIAFEDAAKGPTRCRGRR